MCWNNCYVCNLSDGYGPRQDNRSGPFSFYQMIAFVVVDYKEGCNINWKKVFCQKV